jgi:hypothetical protein
LALGGTCSQAGQCASGFCVDSLCCDELCSGECRTCKTTPGTCTNAPVGLPNRNCKLGCSSDHSQVSDGVCNANGTCDITSTTCPGGAKCSDATNACSDACTSSPDTCPTNYTCDSHNTCKLSLGRPCSSSNSAACVQGYCVDGFCCNTAACVSECDTTNNRLITRQCDSTGGCNTTVTQDCLSTEVCQNLACTPASTGGTSGHRPPAKAPTSTQLLAK